MKVNKDNITYLVEAYTFKNNNLIRTIANRTTDPAEAERLMTSLAATNKYRVITISEIKVTKTWLKNNKGSVE